MVDFAVESLGTARNCEAASRLLAMQWQETGDREIESRPNWILYEKLDSIGALLLVVARRDSKPIGFLLGTIYRHPNATQELNCTISTYFVEEGPMRALILSRMIDFALARLAERGVFRVDAETTFERSAGRIWEVKGFKAVKIGYSCKLKAMPEVRYA